MPRVAAAWLAALFAVCLTGAAVPASPPAGTSAAWWQRAGPAGQRVSNLAALVPGKDQPLWTVRAGQAWLVAASSRVATNSGSPQLQSSLIAGPGALSGVAVGVAEDGSVWRRGQDGHWAESLLLLPEHLFGSIPAVTAVAAFASPISDTVYLGTNGYGVLLSTDGGDDWIRADAGLPSHVLALATDSATASLYAGTDDGLWVHHLRALPAPPAYASGGLWWRRLGVALLAVLAVVMAVVALRIGMAPGHHGPPIRRGRVRG